MFDISNVCDTQTQTSALGDFLSQTWIAQCCSVSFESDGQIMPAMQSLISRQLALRQLHLAVFIALLFTARSDLVDDKIKSTVAR